MKYQVKIKRFNPSNKRNYFQTYDVDLDEALNVLDVIEYIKNHIDPTLTYRAFCKSAICGSCAMVINSTSKLACKINASKNIINGVLLLEPLNGFELIKDLVVNQDKGFDRLKFSNSFMIPHKPPKEEFNITPKEELSYSKQSECILCMACYSDCEIAKNDDKYFAPFVFSKLFRFHNDTRDNDDKIKNSFEGNLFNCIECQACILACPKALKPQFDIKSLQLQATKQGYQNPNENNFNDFSNEFNEFGGFFS